MNTLTINSVSSRLTAADRLDHALARLGVRRNHHRVTPGLYAVGRPDAAAPVLVTANYSLSFDALRSSLSGIDAFILVLDTQGVNVWCAAGKGTFGTDEIVRRIEAVDLARAVTHRRLIVPQLGGAGVAAHEVKRRSGFSVEYGPVDTSDLPEYLRTRKADAGMRRVKFGIKARAVLAVIEAVYMLFPVLAVSAVLRLTGVIAHFYNPVLAGVVAGTILFPMLMPLLPARDFSVKGFIAGILAWAPILVRSLLETGALWWRLAGTAAGSLLITASISAYLALAFTGSTVFTSLSGVRREIFRYIPAMAWTAGIGIAISAALIFI